MGYYYYLSVSYIGFPDGKDDEIEKAIGRKYLSGSGFGFGRRDIGFIFKRKIDAERAVKRVRKIKRRVKCEIYKEEEI